MIIEQRVVPSIVEAVQPGSRDSGKLQTEKGSLVEVVGRESFNVLYAYSIPFIEKNS